MPSTLFLEAAHLLQKQKVTTRLKLALHSQYCLPIRSWSPRNLVIKLHDFSMTVCAVFPDTRKENTEDHLRKESQIFDQTENNESKRSFLPSITIFNLEDTPKASHLKPSHCIRPIDMELSELLVCDS